MRGCTLPYPVGRRWLAAGLLMLVLVMGGGALAGDPGDDDAAGAALAYVDALLRLDADAARPLTCPDDQAQPDFAAALDRLAALDVHIAPPALDAVILQSGQGWAWVRVSGDIWVEIAGLEMPHLLAPAALDLDTLWAVREGDHWAMCATLPERVTAQIEPGDAARLFLNAAFSGDYALASALICADRRGAFSEAQYAAVFGETLAEHTVIDLRDAVFDAVGQPDGTALVTVSGQATFSSDAQPIPMTLPAGSLSGSPIRLVDEDGWKVCG